MKASSALLLLVAVLAVLLPTAIIAAYLFPRAFPWWMDGGDWLKRVNALLGNAYPMWNQTTLQYPPLFFVLVAAFSGPLGEIRSLEIWALIAYALVPLVTYFFAKELFKDRAVAVAGAWLTGFTPIWFEMFGWGGFPDLLGLAMLPLGFLGVLRFSEKGSARNFSLLAIGSVLIPFSHHLTTICFVGVLVVWGLASLVFDRHHLKAIGLALLVTLAAFGVARLAAGPDQFLTYNPAALAYLLANGSTLIYMFKSVPYIIVLYVIAATTMGLFVVERKFRTQTLLLLSWAVVPVIGTQGYLIGIASDYNRVLFFFAQPFMLMVAASLAYRSEVWTFLTKIGGSGGAPRWTGGGRTAKPLIVSAVLVLTLGTTVYAPILGGVSMGNINTYYTNTDIYGDTSKLQVANYITSTTPPTAVIVAENTMGRWIEGYAQRRVLLNLDPRYLFLTGELARDYAANEILFSNMGMRNGYAWVEDQAPYAEFSPLISFFISGEYQQVAFLNDSASSVSWVNTLTGRNFTMPLSDSTSASSYWTVRTNDTATIGATYHIGPVELVRQVSLSSAGGNVTFSFQANSSQRLMRVTALTIALGPMPGLGLIASSLVSNRTIAVVTSQGDQFYASSSSQAFPFKFITSAGTNSIFGRANVWTNNPSNGTSFFTYERSEIAKEYGVTDVVIPKQYLVAVGTTENITLRALPLYENLMRDPEFRVVYYNERAIVLQFVG